jgi:glycosyltransferase involved in cell wall biosynthesis
MPADPKAKPVHLCIWSGDESQARGQVAAFYPGSPIEILPNRLLRISTFAGRARLLRRLRGQAFILHFQSLALFRHKQLIAFLHFLHRCRETVLCDQGGHWEVVRSSAILRSLPLLAGTILRDSAILALWAIYTQVRLRTAKPVDAAVSSSLDIAYLIPSPAQIGSAGGAISHIRGILHGFQSGGRTCRVFTGAYLAQQAFDNEIVAAPASRYFFWGAVMLAYNFTFARGVQKLLGTTRPRFLYQRHLAFAVSGALLSRRLQVPLILEYNGPETWIAHHWDPTPLRRWVGWCEDLTLRSASRIIVVSRVLRDLLVERGVPQERIRIIPNGVDPDFFSPGPGRESGRRHLGLEADEVLVGFVGSFSLWHGIEVLQKAIPMLLSDATGVRLRFLLIGDGLLHAEMRSSLAAYEHTRQVIFTGLLPPSEVVQLLDACDILLSPHIPLPDGSRFFGSPTKLFEYMAMGKAIVASRLDQLAEVLEHGQTGFLVTPGDPAELARAILHLARNPEERERLGTAARKAAVENHSWSGKVALALADTPSPLLEPSADMA